MPGRSLVDALTDFGRREPFEPLFDLPGSLPDLPMPAPDPEPAFVMPDIDAIVADAVARAEAALAERLSEAFEHRLEQERETHRKALADMQEQAGQASGTHLSEALEALEQRLVGATSAAAAQAIAPFVAADLQRKAVEELAAIVKAALRADGAVGIEVKGPQPLLEAFSAAMGEHAGRISASEAESHDLEVTINESIYETRLSDWAATLAEALA